MRIGYFTTDPVNHELAARLAASYGAVVERLGLRDHWQEGDYDVLLYDPDFLPFEEWPAIRTHLLSRRYRTPVGIHSHRLATEELIAFRMRGIATCRLLTRQIIDELMTCRAADTILEGSSGGMETVVDAREHHQETAKSEGKRKTQLAVVNRE